MNPERIDMKAAVNGGVKKDARFRGTHRAPIRKDWSGGSGIYLYCITEGRGGINFGRIGLEEREVYTIRHGELMAVVHDCKGTRYTTGDAQALKSWVMAHNDVVDTAMEMFDAVLPLGLGNIIVGQGGLCPAETLSRWLEKEKEIFNIKLANVKGREEYGVQVLWEPCVVIGASMDIAEARILMEKARSGGPSNMGAGTVYMYEEKLKRLIGHRAEAAADGYYKDFYARIKRAVDGIKIDKIRQTGDKRQSLMNLSCLVRKDGVDALKVILDGIKKEKGFSVRFTGPWPPYSFV